MLKIPHTRQAGKIIPEKEKVNLLVLLSFEPPESTWGDAHVEKSDHILLSKGWNTRVQ